MASEVLRAVDLVPSGSVVSYGDLAELVGATPRQVGAVMRLRGADVAWWRVVDASGRLPQHLLDEARARWADEGIAWTADGRGCRLERHRCDLPGLADAYEVASAGAAPAGSD